MKELIAVAVAFSLALPARAEGPPPPPPDDEDQRRQAAPVEQAGYYESCFGVPRVRSNPFGISGEVVVPVGGSSGGSPSVPVSSKASDEKALLAAVVLAAIVLPAVVFLVDKPAPPLVLQRFRCPTFTLDLLGGAEYGGAALGKGAYGFISTRLSFGVSHIAADFQYDGAPGAVSAVSTHLLIRPTPREHIDGGLAIGYRRSVLRDRFQEGLEVGLPHRYALWRDGLRTVAFELRPMLLLGPGVEPSLEAAFLIPLAQVLHLHLGGRVYTFGGDLLWGLSTGLSLTL